ncbi:Oidioi.mRNA.OKI2018_I69.PAR.g13099.t1.cds [Oikopleura dioica]|uniref:Oidioi.mRNA.OKI2018_I69.PAR.g13099.t1.cds n=1 Tax=Oikopleura dioica TaxID=34765 RepID=A0ABN7S398_OIKDI|nr:Oidioi.mRNA.OKI2018_I69.PAR.g13099.t1.cds [Oikopleura dioica]
MPQPCFDDMKLFIWSGETNPRQSAECGYSSTPVLFIHGCDAEGKSVCCGFSSESRTEKERILLCLNVRMEEHLSDAETVVNFDLTEDQLSDTESIGSASTFIRRATARSSLRSEYSTLDLSKWEAASLASSSVFDDSGNAIMGYRDLVSELRNVERENFTLKPFSGSH